MKVHPEMFMKIKAEVSGVRYQVPGIPLQAGRPADMIEILSPDSCLLTSVLKIQGASRDVYENKRGGKKQVSGARYRVSGERRTDGGMESGSALLAQFLTSVSSLPSPALKK
jgi:hypothetical protein